MYGLWFQKNWNKSKSSNSRKIHSPQSLNTVSWIAWLGGSPPKSPQLDKRPCQWELIKALQGKLKWMWKTHQFFFFGKLGNWSRNDSFIWFFHMFFLCILREGLPHEKIQLESSIYIVRGIFLIFVFSISPWWSHIAIPYHKPMKKIHVVTTYLCIFPWWSQW